MINFRPQVYLLILSKKLAKLVELHICYRKYYDRPTLHYGDKTVKIMVAFADMIFCSIRLIGMLSTTELDTRKFYV